MPRLSALKALSAAPESPQSSPASVVALRGGVVLRPDERFAGPQRLAGIERIASGLAIAAALALHGLVFFALVSRPAGDTSGAGGQHLHAIEVTLVQSTVMESRETKPAEPTPAVKAEIAPEDGDQSPTDAPNRPPTEVSQERAAKPEMDDPQPTPPPKEVPPGPLQKRVEPTPSPPLPEPRSHGGVAATSASEGSNLASGPAAASPGEISRYAAAVRAAIARSRPNGHGRRGVATITFTISAAGKVSVARLTVSSGHTTLDRAALSAVERTKFPVPPSMLSERDLTYVVPFRFQ